MTDSISKITRVTIKDVWRYEDRDLTPWLCDNIDVISESIGVQLINPIKEQSTGVFNVDIKAEDINGDIVVIENQFGTSDHDHLGKLLTYLASFEAKTAIWIVETPRAEHIQTINWLNESSNGCSFYLLKIEAIKIGGSAIAPLITKIVGPSEESRAVGKSKLETAGTHKDRFEFWSTLLSEAKRLGLTSFNAISPTKDSWIGATAGVKGLSYVFWVNQFSSRIELRIDRGKNSEQENVIVFNQLKEYKDKIENVYGNTLDWADLEGYRVCSIRKEFQNGGYKSEENVKIASITELVTSMVKLEKAIKPFIKEIKVPTLVSVPELSTSLVSS